MELKDHEVGILSCLLRNCKSKYRYELDGAEQIITKICNESRRITVREARKRLV